MISALLSFLGGSAFRMVWGEFSAWLTARQEHKHEIERMRAQGDLDAAAHARNIEALRLQSDLGVKTIEVQRDSALAQTEASAWADAVSAVGRTTGIKLLDIWNGIIRPLLATCALVFILAEIVQNGFVLSEWDRELFGAILGIFVADRSLNKRGK